MKAYKKHVLGFLIISILGVVVAFVANKWFDLSTKYEEFKEHQELRQRWGRGEFKQISKESMPELCSAIQRLVSQANTNDWSGTIDESELAKMIALMLRAFSLEDWVSYREFHFPIDTTKGGKFDSQRMKIIKDGWEKHAKKTELVGRDKLTDEEIFVDWGKHLLQTDPNRLCHRCWKAVNLKETTVKLVKVEKPPVLAVDAYARMVEPLRTTSTFASVVRFGPAQDHRASAVVAYIRMPIKMSRGNVGVYPVYASLCWLPSERKWAPLSLV